MQPEALLDNVRAQVLLSKLFWISEVVKFEGCPKCKFDQLETGPEHVWMPYINSVSSKLIKKDSLEVEMANKILDQVYQLKDIEIKGKQKIKKIAVLVDEDSNDIFSLANRILRQSQLSEE